MGLFNWVMDKLTGEQEQPSRAPATPRTSPESAVATLEPTPDQDAQGNATRWWQPEGVSLTEPIPFSPPDMCADARALENLLVEHFDGHDLSLPPLPRVPEIVLQKLGNRKLGLVDVAKDIQEDQVSAAAVLRLANSPLYRGMNKITGIEQAVVRLGASAIRTLMMHQSLRSLSGTASAKTKRLAETLSLRALASASVMRSLSKFTGVNQEEAFMMGLMHDIGSVIVLRIAGDQQSIIRNDISDAIFEYLFHETHQEFGELVADAWQLPAEMKSLIGNHHTYPADDDPLRKERIQLELTDMIGALLGYAPYAPYDLLNSRAAADLGLKDNPNFTIFLNQLPEELEQAMAAYA